MIARAYPRSRGATFEVIAMDGSTSGLSPLARGNQNRNLQFFWHHGPIPARAGQPRAFRIHNRRSRAYPRSRGATRCYSLIDLGTQGLSPLARGNRREKAHCVAGWGPIPARAGQPGRNTRVRPRKRAYPRSRGATSCIQLIEMQKNFDKSIQFFSAVRSTCHRLQSTRVVALPGGQRQHHQ